MDCKIVIAAVMLSLRVCAQPFGLQVSDLSWPTDGTTQTLVIQPPITQSFFGFFPENTPTIHFAIVATNLVVDPQGIITSVHFSSSATNGNSQSSPISIWPNTITTFIFYSPNLNFTGTDGWTYYGFNKTQYVTNSIQVLSYNTNFTSTCSSSPFTGTICGFLLPSATGLSNISYYFSVYSSTSPYVFSNCYYYNSSGSGWGKVNTPQQYPDTFPLNGNSLGYIVPSIPFTNAVLCANISVSNPPCVMNPPTNFFITVVTNSQNTFQLQGSQPTYVIIVPPTNGYLTNLNGATGQITYVESNSTATVDQFYYCTSNSPVCRDCGSVSIGIINQVTCGVCQSVLPINGGVVTGDINFNTGIPFENVCISYSNEVCLNVTNCTTTDQFGNASFFVQFCPGSSNFCIVSLQACSNVCTFYGAQLSGIVNSGGGATVFNGDYVVSAVLTGPPILYVYTNLTQTPFSGGSTEMYYYPEGSDDLQLGFLQYAILWEPGFADYTMYTITPANCTNNYLTNWTIATHWIGSLTVPTNSAISNTVQIPINCIQSCP